MFNRVISRVFSGVMLCLLSLLLFFSIVSTTYISDVETVFYVSDIPFVHLAMLVAVIGSLYFLKGRLRLTEKTVGCIAAVLFGLLSVYILSSMFYPRFDQRHVMNIAAQMLRKEYKAFQIGGYAEIYPYQNGLLLFYELLALLFGANNAVAIQFVNLFFIFSSYAALYCILKKLTSKYLSIMIGLLLFLPLWGYVSFIYGNVPAFSFGMWSLYFSVCFFQSRKLWTVIPASVCMAVSCILKMNFMILMIAIIGVAVLLMIHEKKLSYIFLILGMLLFVMAGKQGITEIVRIQTGMNPTEGIPGISYIAMGLHEKEFRGAGWHDNYPENTYSKYDGDASKVREESVKDIKSSVNNFIEHPQYMVGFFVRKIASMWNEPSYDALSMQMNRSSVSGSPPADWVQKLTTKGRLNSSVYNLMNLIQTVILAGAAVYYVLNFKNENFLKNIFGLFFVGGFLCHLLWEASSQYALFYVMLLIPYCVEGIYDLILWFDKADRRKIIRFMTCVAIVTVLVSIPSVCSFITLNRSTVMYQEYLRSR